MFPSPGRISCCVACQVLAILGFGNEFAIAGTARPDKGQQKASNQWDAAYQAALHVYKALVDSAEKGFPKNFPGARAYPEMCYRWSKRVLQAELAKSRSRDAKLQAFKSHFQRMASLKAWAQKRAKFLDRLGRQDLFLLNQVTFYYSEAEAKLSDFRRNGPKRAAAASGSGK